VGIIFSTDLVGIKAKISTLTGKMVPSFNFLLKLFLFLN